jgi:hypothetical protein
MTDLAELYARDPLSLTDSDLDIIILKQREARANYNLAERKDKVAKAPKKPAGPMIDLMSLGLVKK